jgi:serine/threonine protein kinase
MIRRSGSGYAEPVEQIEDADAFEAAYTTVRHIGAGASGRVLLVEHRRTRAKCVLKKIPMRSMKDAGVPGGAAARPPRRFAILAGRGPFTQASRSLAPPPSARLAPPSRAQALL